MSSRVLVNALNALSKSTVSTVTNPVLQDTVSRSLATAASGASFKLPDIAYDYGALEPYISADIMKIHHTKHHNAYVTNLNIALDKYRTAELNDNVSEMITLQGAIRFNGGGHINHSIFWENLAPKGKGGGGEPDGELGKAINDRFGSFAKFKETMNTQGTSVQVSRKNRYDSPPRGRVQHESEDPTLSMNFTIKYRLLGKFTYS
jgi:hypothetical protein